MKSRILYIGIPILLIIVGFIMVVYGFTKKTVHEIAWGLLVPGYVYFALIATGSSIVNSVYTIFHYRGPGGELEKIIKLGVWFSFASIVISWVLILADISKPLEFWRILVSFNIESRIAWMALLYVFYGIFLAVELVYLIRASVSERLRVLKWLELTIATIVLIVIVATASNLAQVFGTISAIPAWYGPHLVPYFIVLAVLSGAAGQALFVTLTLWKDLGLRKFIAWYYGWILVLVTPLLAILVIWNIITAWYNPQVWLVYNEVIRGAYALWFWFTEVVLGIIVVIALAYYAATRYNIVAFLTASVIALIAGFIRTHTIIVVPQLKTPEVLGLVRVAEYHVTWGEALILVGAIIIWPSLYILGQQLLPLLHEEQPRRLWIFK